MRAPLLSFLGFVVMWRELLVMFWRMMLQVTQGSFSSSAVMSVLRVERSRRRSSERSCEEGGGVVLITEGSNVMVDGFRKYLSSKLDTEGIKRVMGLG